MVYSLSATAPITAISIGRSRTPGEQRMAKLVTGALKGARLSRAARAAYARRQFSQTSKEVDLRHLRHLRRPRHQRLLRPQVPITTRSLLARATKWLCRSRVLTGRCVLPTAIPRIAP